MIQVIACSMLSVPLKCSALSALAAQQHTHQALPSPLLHRHAHATDLVTGGGPISTCTVATIKAVCSLLVPCKAHLLQLLQQILIDLWLHLLVSQMSEQRSFVCDTGKLTQATAQYDVNWPID